MRADPELAAEYEALKLGLAQKHGDVGAYTVDKRPLVACVLAMAGLQPGRR